MYWRDSFNQLFHDVVSNVEALCHLVILAIMNG